MTKSHGVADRVADAAVDAEPVVALVDLRYCVEVVRGHKLDIVPAVAEHPLNQEGKHIDHVLKEPKVVDNADQVLHHQDPEAHEERGQQHRLLHRRQGRDAVDLRVEVVLPADKAEEDQQDAPCRHCGSSSAKS